MSTRYRDPRDEQARPWHDTPAGRDLHHGWGRFRAYVASLGAEQWLLFLAGLAIGLILG